MTLTEDATQHSHGLSEILVTVGLVDSIHNGAEQSASYPDRHDRNACRLYYLRLLPLPHQDMDCAQDTD